MPDITYTTPAFFSISADGIDNVAEVNNNSIWACLSRDNGVRTESSYIAQLLAINSTTLSNIHIPIAWSPTATDVPPNVRTQLYAFDNTKTYKGLDDDATPIYTFGDNITIDGRHITKYGAGGTVGIKPTILSPNVTLPAPGFYWFVMEIRANHTFYFTKTDGLSLYGAAPNYLINVGETGVFTPCPTKGSGPTDVWDLWNDPSDIMIRVNHGVPGYMQPVTVAFSLDAEHWSAEEDINYYTITTNPDNEPDYTLQWQWTGRKPLNLTDTSLGGSPSSGNRYVYARLKRQCYLDGVTLTTQYKYAKVEVNFFGGNPIIRLLQISYVSDE